MFPVYVVTVLLLFLWGTSATANDVRVELNLGTPPDFLQIMESNGGLGIVAELKSADSQVVLEGRAQLKAGSGRISAVVHLQDVPTGVTLLCYEVTPKEIGESWFVHRQCDQIRLQVAQVANNLVYTDFRGLAVISEYLNLERNGISERIRDSTSSDTALGERDREVRDYLEFAPHGTLGRLDARLVAELVNAAVYRVGTRVPSSDYFSLASPASEISQKLHDIVASDRSTRGNTNAAKELFQAYMRIDLDQYSKGRVGFEQDYFDTLQFLAAERSQIARENGLSGDTTAKEFSEFCKNFATERHVAECLVSLTAINDVLLTEAALTSDDGTNANLQIAVRYQIDAASSVSGFLHNAGTTITAEEVSRIQTIREVYAPIVCSGNANCIVP